MSLYSVRVHVLECVLISDGLIHLMKPTGTWWCVLCSVVKLAEVYSAFPVHFLKNSRNIKSLLHWRKFVDILRQPL